MWSWISFFRSSNLFIALGKTWIVLQCVCVRVCVCVHRQRILLYWGWAKSYVNHWKKTLKVFFFLIIKIFKGSSQIYISAQLLYYLRGISIKCWFKRQFYCFLWHSPNFPQFSRLYYRDKNHTLGPHWR